MQPVNVFDFEALAQTRMEPAAWDYYQSGSDDEVTLRANRAAFERIQLRPRTLVDVSACDMRTTVLGTPIKMPIMVAPTAYHCLCAKRTFQTMKRLKQPLPLHGNRWPGCVP